MQVPLRRSCTYSRPRNTALFIVALLLLTLIPSLADILGRLSVTVTDSETGKPIASAIVTFHDSIGVHPDEKVITDKNGVALSPPLENRAWQISTDSQSYTVDTRSTTVVQDTTTPINVALKLTVGSSGVSHIRINLNRTNSDTVRNQTFISTVPATGANPQNLGRVLSTVPGFVPSSVNAVHPRGEHASTSVYVDGFLVPGINQGRAAPQISPDIIQSLDVITGGFAPEYGSETAAVLNLTLRAGPITPFQSLELGTGGYRTSDGILSFGGQAGTPLDGSTTGGGDIARKFRYLVNLDSRSTDNALEPPQPDNQDAHNSGHASTIFGNFDYIADRKDTFTLLMNTAPGQTEIANRTGLSSKYIPVGQGYGYGGARNADGSESGVAPNSGLLGDEVLPLGSQQAVGQDIYQNDENSFVGLNYRHTFSPTLTSLLSLGGNRSRLDIRNNNPSINLNSFDEGGDLSTIDNSIEFNPTVLRNSTQTEVSGSLTSSQHTHTYKAGFIYQNQVGDEEYQFIPQSQLALDALGAVQTGGPQLTPNGTYETDAGGAPVLDVLGNQVYLMTPGSTTPIVRVHKSGYYAAGYLQDTWNATRKFTLNYGARLDSYGQKQTIATTTSVNEAYLGPRFNAAYTTTPGSILRLIYDKMFTQPPLAQGAIVGTDLKPETFDHYEANFERTLAPGQSAKIAYYYKNVRNQNDTGILIPYTQIGAYTTLQYQYASLHGIEFSYNLTPRNNIGFGSYIAYAHEHARPGGLDQTGAPAPTINDHNQYDTLSTGLDYTWRSQAYAGVDVYYGSGEASSVLGPINPSNSNLLDAGRTNSNTLVNLRFGSAQTANGFGLRLDVENVFDSLQVLNFNSGFSGTRFQQGRRVLLSLTGRI